MENCEGSGQTFDVKAERMTFDRQTQTFLFQERVRVRRCDMTIQCDHLRVFNDAAGQHVERIVFTGHVRMHQGTRRVTAERAEYFDAEQKLILTGKPKAWDTVEQNELMGEEIVVFLEEDKLLVKQAHVRFHPRQQVSESQ
jgi:lipopolysaccharide export system protein LptA